eukprot:198696_1
MAQQAPPGTNVCFHCGINSTEALYCTNCLVSMNIPEDDDDDNKDFAIEGGDERVAFLDASRRKKQYYSQYSSLSDHAKSQAKLDDTILVDDPHFVLTLHDLSDCIGNDDNNRSDIDQLKELQNCIVNKQQNDIIDNIRGKLGRVYGVHPARVIITEIFHGSANIGHIIIDYKKDAVIELIKTASEFEKKIKSEFKQYKDTIITPPPESKDGSYAVVPSYHVSCASGKACGNWNCPDADCRLGGVVIYMKDGQTRWKCNGRSCRIGYIIVKQTSKIPDSVTSNHGQVHGRIYKSVFNEEPDCIVGSGFSRSKGEWRWGSGSFNCGGTNKGNSKQYHSNGAYMNDIESKWIEKSVRNWWDSGNQNTKVDESIVIFKDQKL